jgi:VIT1/CCC1 family predicted Fe2+/Mn2+ transporter
VNEMMHSELQISPEKNSPLQASLVTFVSFVIIGILPLLPFLIPGSSELVNLTPFTLTCLLTAVAFVVIGFTKAHINFTSRFMAISETLLLGAAAALIAYFAGFFLESMIIK